VTQANGATAPETARPAAHMAPVPIELPVMMRVPIAVLAWSPITQPMNWRPVRSMDAPGRRRMATSP